MKFYPGGSLAEPGPRPRHRPARRRPAGGDRRPRRPPRPPARHPAPRPQAVQHPARRGRPAARRRLRPGQAVRPGAGRQPRPPGSSARPATWPRSRPAATGRSPPPATSTAWGRSSTSCSPAAAVPGRDRAGDARCRWSSGRRRRPRLAQPAGAGRPGDDLPEVPGEGPGPALRQRRRRWPTT